MELVEGKSQERGVSRAHRIGRLTCTGSWVGCGAGVRCGRNANVHGGWSEAWHERAVQVRVWRNYPYRHEGEKENDWALRELPCGWDVLCMATLRGRKALWVGRVVQLGHVRGSLVVLGLTGPLLAIGPVEAW